MAQPGCWWGLAGNLDAMELGAASFAGPPGSRGHALAADATAAAVRRLIDVVSEAPRATWAAAELAHPSLMTGAAGLGMALLRAAEPRSPSPLAPLSFA